MRLPVVKNIFHIYFYLFLPTYNFILLFKIVFFFQYSPNYLYLLFLLFSPILIELLYFHIDNIHTHFKTSQNILKIVWCVKHAIINIQ